MIQRAIRQSGSGGTRSPPCGRIRKDGVCIVIIMKCEPQLLQVVLTLRPTSRFACLLDRRQKQGNKNRDNRDDNQ